MKIKPRPGIITFLLLLTIILNILIESQWVKLFTIIVIILWGITLFSDLKRKNGISGNENNTDKKK